MTETLGQGSKDSTGEDGACTHRHRMSIVVTELGYHTHCSGCGAIGPGSTGVEDARRTLLAMVGREDREHLRYLG
jgi:hypothetical protein